jgi:monoamine oxidase
MVGGLGAAYHGMAALGLLKLPPAGADSSSIPELTKSLGRGKKVLVLGGGLAGICSAYLLANSGFQVRVLEANNRAGGRSLTIRKGDTFREVEGPEQTCRFTNDSLYGNLGPGRIPQHHDIVLDYCRRFGVKLEPYIFLSQANLLQSDSGFEGKPVQFRRLQYSLQGEVAELLARSAQEGELDKELTGIDHEKFLLMLKNYGGLTDKFQFEVPQDMSKGYARTGYSVEPQAGLDHGKAFPTATLAEIMQSGLWNEELFNSLEYYWQSSLMQPVGGMDMIWKAFLEQPVPGTALFGSPSSGQAKVLDLIKLNSPAKAVKNTSRGVEVAYGDGVVETADFCISTMAPKQLKKVGRGFSQGFSKALEAIDYDAAHKIAWESRTRFWEQDDEIYGGISWTKHPTTQIWYPSSGFGEDTGVLTGSYTNEEAAIKFGELPLAERFELALEGGERLHPGNYRKNIVRDTALAIAWHKMPYFEGGWPGDTFERKPEAYVELARSVPEGQVYLAGDYISYWPGWMEGALGAANLAYSQIQDRIMKS